MNLVNIAAKVCDHLPLTVELIPEKNFAVFYDEPKNAFSILLDNRLWTDEQWTEAIIRQWLEWQTAGFPDTSKVN